MTPHPPPHTLPTAIGILDSILYRLQPRLTVTLITRGVSRYPIYLFCWRLRKLVIAVELYCSLELSYVKGSSASLWWSVTVEILEVIQYTFRIGGRNILVQLPTFLKGQWMQTFSFHFESSQTFSASIIIHSMNIVIFVICFNQSHVFLPIINTLRYNYITQKRL